MLIPPDPTFLFPSKWRDSKGPMSDPIHLELGSKDSHIQSQPVIFTALLVGFLQISLTTSKMGKPTLLLSSKISFNFSHEHEELRPGDTGSTVTIVQCVARERGRAEIVVQSAHFISTYSKGERGPPPNPT